MLSFAVILFIVIGMVSGRIFYICKAKISSSARTTTFEMSYASKNVEAGNLDVEEAIRRESARKPQKFINWNNVEWTS